MTEEIPFLAVGNDELGEPVGDTIFCRVCGKEHPVEFGTSQTLLKDGTWADPVPSKTLGFYRCGESTYLASIDGRALK